MYKFLSFCADLWDYIIDMIDRFLFQEHHPNNPSFGGEYYIRKTVKTGNIALLLVLIILVILLSHEC